MRMETKAAAPSHAAQAAPPPLARALKNLLPEIGARSEEIERTRFLPQDLAKKLSRTGLYHMCVPRRYGGLETPPLQQIALIEQLAHTDGATAWCGFIGATTGAMAAYLPPASARSIYGKRSTITAGVLAPMGRAQPATRKGRAGYIVSGRWQWGSGSRNAQWIMGGSLVLEDGAPRLRPSGAPSVRMMAAPASEVEILDTWHSSGLCGTGSNDFRMDKLFIPEEHSAAFAEDEPLQRPLYAFPQFGLLAIGIASTALGLARRALDEIQALASGKTPQGSSRSLANRPATQAAVAEAYAERRAVHGFLCAAVDEAWEAARRKGRIGVAHKRDVRLASTLAARRSAHIVDVAYNLAGGSSVYRRSPLQRIFRDIHVLTQHMMVMPATYELGGRLLLGLETNTDSL